MYQKQSKLNNNFPNNLVIPKQDMFLRLMCANDTVLALNIVKKTA